MRASTSFGSDRICRIVPRTLYAAVTLFTYFMQRFIHFMLISASALVSKLKRVSTATVRGDVVMDTLSVMAHF